MIPEKIQSIAEKIHSVEVIYSRIKARGVIVIADGEKGSRKNGQNMKPKC